MIGEKGRLETLFEPIERRLYVDLYEALPESVARDCAISWELADRVLRLSCAAADHPFFNRVMGVGASGRALGRWLGRLEDDYRALGIGRWMLQASPAELTPALERAVAERGLVALRGWAKHAARVDRIAATSEGRRCDLRIEEIGPEKAGDWASILVPAFRFPAAAADWPAATVGRPGWHHYVAYDGTRAAACAAMFVADGVATLTFAATHESYRRRGAQSALIARRVRDARRMELDWLVTETDEDLPDRPNPSYRNIVRLGLPVRYVRSNWGPPPPASRPRSAPSPGS